MLLKTITGLSALLSVILLALGCFGIVWLVPVFAGIWLGLAIIALAFLWIVCALVDLDKPQEEDDPVYRSIMYVYIEALMNLVLVRLHTRGLENTPKEGRFLLVCNHLFIADPGILLHAFRMIKEDKVSVAAFPEGYTSKDGKLHHFRSGVFKIAQKANVPIVVCTIQGTRNIFPNLRKLRTTPVELHLVEVIPAQELKGKTAVEIGDRVYESMIADLGEDFRVAE